MANFGFVDANNLLIAGAVCEENDTETIERIKNQFGASEAYQFTDDKIFMPGTAFWTGTKFALNKPFPSWVEENDKWVAPIPYPSEGAFDWDEQSLSWVAKI